MPTSAPTPPERLPLRTITAVQTRRNRLIWSAEPFATVSDGCAQIRSFWIIASGWRTEPDSQLDG
jgi:hypothetical protein